MLPFVYPSAWLLKSIRRTGLHRLPLCKRALLQVGVLPIRNHYYEPRFDFRHAGHISSRDRRLPGIDWNVPAQLRLLDSFVFGHELGDIPDSAPPTPATFYWRNGLFESGDAEFWYQLIRAKKPTRIIEIGSGFSTLIAIRAIKQNREDDPSYSCTHDCVEPYEMPWLETSGVNVVRRKAEDLPLSFYQSLGNGDCLFIDSSHIIRPGGDVLFELLEVLPSLSPGVIVHIHDIFSPQDYLDGWIEDEVRLWNEQYLLEAFLTHNTSWEVLGALNLLKHRHFDQLLSIAPSLTTNHEPGSFYIRRTG